MNSAQTEVKTNDGLYKGDLLYESFEDHLKKTQIANTWQKICENELDFPHGQVSDAPIRRLEPFWRLFAAVVHARIEMLSDFDSVVATTEDNKAFLRKLRTNSKSRGREIFSVPEDMLLLLVLKKGGKFLTQRYVREVVQFEPRLGEAIIDTLAGPD